MAAQVVFEVPDILQYLLEEDLKALLSTCSSLRRRVHEFESSITMSDPRDMSVLRRGHWSRRRKLSFLGSMQASSMRQLLHIRCSHLSTLDFEGA